jgi:STE24 endopeptidase
VNEDRAARYHRLKRQVELVSLVWGVVLLGGLLATGAGARLRDAAESIGARLWTPVAPAAAVVAFVVLLSLLSEVVNLPLGFYSGFLLERRYGLSNEAVASWLTDQAKSFALGILFGGGAACLVYLFIWLSPERWWLAVGLLFALILIALTNLVPVLLLPLFYTIKPLDRDALRERLMALASRVGTRVLGAYEWGLGEKTKKANAALIGLGQTRRILVSDTMLSAYSDDEIEVVLAHELAHHVHGDIWKGIVFQSALILAGCFVASRILAAAVRPLGLRGVNDLAGLPLLLLSAGAVSIVMVPVAHALSRAYERSADRFALETTKNPSAFITAMRRLGAQNLAEDDPSTVVQWLFYSHPPIRERIAAAEAFRNT